MGIDYVVHYDCEPKRALTLEGLMARLKGRERADAIIELYRAQGDTRPPREMGFEMVRRTAEGGEEQEVIVVQDLLDAAEELMPWEKYCVGCPANHMGRPFGCIGAINYPLSLAGERWLLDQLPGNDYPLVYLLLQKAIHEQGYHGEAAARLRAQSGVFLESGETPVRSVDGFVVTGDQVFEMLLLSGHIRPAHGALLLQFFDAIYSDLDADIMMRLADPPSVEWIDQTVPFLQRAEPSDDETVAALKRFFHALYTAYRLGVPLLLDV